MKSIPEAVTVSVIHGDCSLKIEEDGWLGHILAQLLPSNACVSLNVQILPGHDNLHVLFVDGGKSIVEMKNRAKPPNRSYRMKVSILGSDVYYTRYPQNRLLLLKLNPDGTFWIWEIAIISQKGEFFLTGQQTYSDCCYVEEGEVICPCFKAGSGWPQMHDFLSQRLKACDLPPIEDYIFPSRPSVEGLSPNTAQVLWFNFAWGVGALNTLKGEARVHWSQITRTGRRAYLNKGELVQYQRLDSPKETIRTTSFRKEAFGISLLE